MLWGAALLLAGCGSGGASKERLVQGEGYRFTAPAAWTIVRSGQDVRVSKGLALVSVERFRLQRSFRPSLWAKVVPELDGAAGEVARQQHGQVRGAATVTISGGPARRYDVDYERDGKHLVERIAFVLRGKTEYLLLCRYERGGAIDACERLLTSFRLAAA